MLEVFQDTEINVSLLYLETLVLRDVSMRRQNCWEIAFGHDASGKETSLGNSTISIILIATPGCLSSAVSRRSRFELLPLYAQLAAGSKEQPSHILDSICTRKRLRITQAEVQSPFAANQSAGRADLHLRRRITLTGRLKTTFSSFAETSADDRRGCEGGRRLLLECLRSPWRYPVLRVGR
eukprot:scpid11717/ scgid12848/ 